MTRTTGATDGIEVQRTGLNDVAALKQEWLALEGRADTNVFLSWQWIGVWLEVYQPAIQVLRVFEADQLIGLGLVVEVKERRHSVLVSQCLRLHQTGHQHLDQIWIEYNGFLAEAGREAEVAAACMSYLSAHWGGWDEFVVGAIEQGEAERFSRMSGLDLHIRWEAPCYGVDLDMMRTRGQQYLDTLSRNTRYQIRRAHRLYEERGPVRLVRPNSLDEALATFADIGPLHLERWGAGKDESGFANPEFINFHRCMIERHWADGGVELITVMAGDDRIASFYNLVYRGVAYFYLGGLAVENDNKLKPGLLGHSLCIEDYRERGFHYYDFMGGEERYKANLGTLHRHLVQVALQRSHWKFKLENAARQAKHQLLGRSRKAKQGQQPNNGKPEQP